MLIDFDLLFDTVVTHLSFVHKLHDTEGAANQEVDGSSSAKVGATDLLIVGPGVLGRLVAENWRKVR